ncbi:MAG TPA: DNA primase [Steroidobacteraceae bacterium]|jgi:DNA primase|nr:DNA primase [Steroidobacteraceae bacterium]
MSRIPQSFIDELIARADIVEIVGLRVPLKKAGREYKACCPFHSEKTPSFWVSPEKQFYHCFGCAAHGTALGFLMAHDRLTFPEAIEELASRLGLEVPHEAAAAGSAPRGADEDLYKLMASVAAYYAEALTRDARARDYLSSRGIAAATLAQFAIGYARDSWNDVLRRFGGDDAARQRLGELGLIIEREGAPPRDGERHYDRFRDRIMFPIRDARGRTIAFGGRIIDQGEPKYLNSPETTLFHKGRELYGLYEARHSRVALKRLLVVEGYMDVVRLHQAGMAYAVATLGTATTAEHLKRIFRVVNEVVFAFDGDRAGRAAAWRALQNTLPEAREGREIRFLFLPEGHDPDTLVGAEGREAFEKRMAAALPLSEYLVREVSADIDLSHADGRARFAEAARPLVAKLAHGLYRELVLERIAATIKLSAARLQQLWGEASRTSQPPAPQRAAPRAAISAGRGSLVRQAIVRLLQFPATAARVTVQERADLDRLHEPGIELLRELIDDLKRNPAKVSAQVIERWADKPERESLEKLLQKEEVITNAAAAGSELRAALIKLAELADTQRLQELEIKSRTATLDRSELQEFQRLTTHHPAGKASGP